MKSLRRLGSRFLLLPKGIYMVESVGVYSRWDFAIAQAMDELLLLMVSTKWEEVRREIHPYILTVTL